MPNTGPDLGSDLWDLMRVARGHLPNMAAAFAEAAGHVHDTGKSDDGAFALRVRTSFQEFRNEYHRLLIESQANMQDSSTALVQVINDYATTDSAAGTQLGNLITEYNDDHEEDYPTAQPGQPYEPPKYSDPDPMEEVDSQQPHYPGAPVAPTENNAPDDE